MELITNIGKNGRAINYKGLIDLLNSESDVIKFKSYKESFMFIGFTYNLLFNNLTFDLSKKNEISMQPNKHQAPEVDLEIYNLGRIRYKKNATFKLTPNIHIYSTDHFVIKYFLNEKHKHTPFKEKKEKALNDIISSVFNNLLVNKTIYTKDIITKLNLCKRNNNKKYIHNLKNKIPNNVPYEKKAPLSNLKILYNTTSFLHTLNKEKLYLD